MPLSHLSAKWKGKGKQAVRADAQGQGGTNGVVLPLDVVESSGFQISYTIPILVGENQQNFSLQVDTGSSDLWIASTSCSTSSCGMTNGKLYNPSQATQTSQTFSIQYLQGSVSGPIVWDQVELGGYTIFNQALAAADDVQSEPLSNMLQGVLGLALPLNSVIAGLIPPVTGNTPDGAAFASNLFGITPTSDAPAARFLSLSLSRPGSDRIPSLLGIGQHPPQIVSDPSRILYGPLVSEREGILFWKTILQAITVYVDGQPKRVLLSSAAQDSIYPTATLDSGVPLILTTSAIANGIYGAIGIDPASDGQYYVPCTQPLNMTITLDNRPEIPIHPLDLTSEPPQGSTSQYCIGLIQTADAQIMAPTSDTGDMILGVPFLRNVYTVMAYEPPNAQGIFISHAITPPSQSVSDSINPRLGLLNLTDPTVAMEEFRQVRILGQPLTTGQPTASSGPPEKKLSVGTDVLIGLGSFVALCFFLFASRWFFGHWMRRRGKARAGKVGLDDPKTASSFGGEYRLTHRASQSSLDGSPSEDVLRQRRFEAYMDKERINSGYTTDSNRTRVNSDIDPDDPDADGELGYRKPRRFEYEPKGISDPWDDTLIEKTAPVPDALPDLSDSEHGSPTPRARTSMDTPTGLPFRRLPPGAQRPQHPNQRAPSVSLPLLVHGHQRDGSRGSTAEDVDLSLADLDEFGVGAAAAGLAGRGSMAGIGTAARGGRVDPVLRHGQGSNGSLRGIVPFAAPPADAELGLGPPPMETETETSPPPPPPPRRMPSGPRPLALESGSLKNQS